MSIKNGRDYRNWLVNPEEHMRIKEERRLLKFKIQVFNRELKREKKRYESLLDGQDARKESYKPAYQSRKELDEAYVVGAVSDKEYMRNRSAIWQVYSDRGHIANIEWLESELEKYQKMLDSLESYMARKKLESKKRYRQRINARRRFNAYRRRRYRQNKKAELEARWKKYGLK